MIKRYSIYRDADDNERPIEEKDGKWVKYEDFIAILNEVKNCDNCKYSADSQGTVCQLKDYKYVECQDSEPRLKHWESR